MQQKLFETYFSVDEAARLLPFVQETLEKGHAELTEMHDAMVLYKRMHQLREQEGPLSEHSTATGDLAGLMQHKWHAYENSFYRWVNVLAERGIQVRDFKKGLIDFPYQAADGREYCLCWHLGEDGLFYYHDIYEGFSGRKPISSLPL